MRSFYYSSIYPIYNKKEYFNSLNRLFKHGGMFPIYLHVSYQLIMLLHDYKFFEHRYKLKNVKIIII